MKITLPVKFLCVLFIIQAMIFLSLVGCTNHIQDPVSGSWTVTDNILKDPDGNTYTTVIIGTQVWTVENLNTTRYNDGTAIPHITNAKGTSPAYYYYNNSTKSSERQRWGALYNWYAVNTGKLAPTGWRVPTDEDWMALSDYLGGESVAGGKLKQTGTLNWKSPNTGANNESGFSALPGGCRGSSGGFGGQNVVGHWWSTSEHDDTTHALSRDLNYDNEYLVSFPNNKKIGFSVRLVQDLN